MNTFCGIDYCKDCEKLETCGGCEKCKGHPFNGSCIVERNKNFNELKAQLVKEINDLNIAELHIDDLNILLGEFVNLEYPISNGTTVKFLNDYDVYLGNQIERKENGRCYGVIANEEFILVSEYGCYGANPELLVYKRR